MENIINNIAHQAGINEAKAKIAFSVITSHLKDNFPMLNSVVDLMLEFHQSSLTREKSFITDFLDNPIFYN
ncbi:MAG TPA: hypothetical protein VGI82_00295 [Chitinophagaceae bacterium]